MPSQAQFFKSASGNVFSAVVDKKLLVRLLFYPEGITITAINSPKRCENIAAEETEITKAEVAKEFEARRGTMETFFESLQRIAKQLDSQEQNPQPE